MKYPLTLEIIELIKADRLCAYFPEIQRQTPEVSLQVKGGCSVQIDNTKMERCKNQILKAIMSNEKLSPELRVELYAIITENFEQFEKIWR